SLIPILPMIVLLLPALGMRLYQPIYRRLCRKIFWLGTARMGVSAASLLLLQLGKQNGWVLFLSTFILPITRMILLPPFYTSAKEQLQGSLALPPKPIPSNGVLANNTPFFAARPAAPGFIQNSNSIPVYQAIPAYVQNNIGSTPAYQPANISPAPLEIPLI